MNYQKITLLLLIIALFFLIFLIGNANVGIPTDIDACPKCESCDKETSLNNPENTIDSAIKNCKDKGGWPHIEYNHPDYQFVCKKSINIEL